MRSMWKGNFVFFKKKYIGNNTIILNEFLRKVFTIYNGKAFTEFIVKRENIGFKLGEFIFTRKVGVQHKKKVKLKQGKKK